MTLFELRPSQRRGSNSHLDPAVWPLGTHFDELGRLCIGGVAGTDIAAEFGTPAYVLDEEDFRGRIRDYRDALPGVDLVYGGKALLSAAVAGWAAAEGAGIGVSSGGELATALAGGVPPSRIVLHGDAKTAADLRGAVAAGVGRIVIDSPGEIALLAGRVRRRQRVFVRVIPDVDAEQKFGFTLADGRASGAVKRILDQPSLELVGLHCQLGSQLSDPGVYARAIRQMMSVLAEVRDRYHVVLSELDLGGGQAVPYVSGDSELCPRELAAVISAALTSACAEFGYPRPRMVVEPGRAIAARAGVTLYRVITAKRQTDGRTFVAVDGPTPAEPRTTYTVALANRHRSAGNVPATIVGRNWQTGGEIARDVQLPADIHPGDLLAVACTGAYHHSMGTSCNLAGGPPLVAVAAGRCHELVRRETVADLLARDRGWPGAHQDHAATAS